MVPDLEAVAHVFEWENAQAQHLSESQWPKIEVAN
jgi:hypothetical protein